MIGCLHILPCRLSSPYEIHSQLEISQLITTAIRSTFSVNSTLWCPNNIYFTIWESPHSPKFLDDYLVMRSAPRRVESSATTHERGGAGQ